MALTTDDSPSILRTRQAVADKVSAQAAAEANSGGNVTTLPAKLRDMAETVHGAPRERGNALITPATVGLIAALLRVAAETIERLLAKQAADAAAKPPGPSEFA